MWMPERPALPRAHGIRVQPPPRGGAHVTLNSPSPRRPSLVYNRTHHRRIETGRAIREGAAMERETTAEQKRKLTERIKMKALEL